MVKRKRKLLGSRLPLHLLLGGAGRHPYSIYTGDTWLELLGGGELSLKRYRCWPPCPLRLQSNPLLSLSEDSPLLWCKGAHPSDEHHPTTSSSLRNQQSWLNPDVPSKDHLEKLGVGMLLLLRAASAQRPSSVTGSCRVLRVWPFLLVPLGWATAFPGTAEGFAPCLGPVSDPPVPRLASPQGSGLSAVTHPLPQMGGGSGAQPSQRWRENHWTRRSRRRGSIRQTQSWGSSNCSRNPTHKGKPTESPLPHPLLLVHFSPLPRGSGI